MFYLIGEGIFVLDRSSLLGAKLGIKVVRRQSINNVL